MDLKNTLTSPDTMLLRPDFTKPFEVHTDASKYGCAGMLAQYYKTNYGQLNMLHGLSLQQSHAGSQLTKNYLL